MKVSTRLILIVASSLLGLALFAGFALYSVRTSMMNDREAQIRTLLRMATTVAERFHAQEVAGKLSHEAAQKGAAEAMLGMRAGDVYLFARNAENVMMVHAKTKEIGKKDLGAVQPDGRPLTVIYKEKLAKADPALLHLMTARPGRPADELQPKLNGVTHYAPWDWTIGTGFFVDDIDTEFKHNALILGGIGLLLATLTGLGTILLSRSLYRDLGGEPKAAMEATLAIASGKLDTPLPAASGNSLMAGLSRMQEQLRAIISEVQHGSRTLHQATTDIAGRIEEIRSNSSRASEATSSTAAAIEEMTVSIGQIAEGSHTTESISTQSTKLAETGGQQVTEVADAIEKVSAQIKDASAQIGTLAERSRQIDHIALTIEDIASQTNLLALNAAIEAARAGEQGRGFAVVADEVRKLAERTSKATQEITQTVAAIQTDTQSVVDSMDAIGPQIQGCVDKVAQATNALHEIRSSSHETLAQLRDIAHATAEQNAASNNIASNVEQIAHMADESERSVAQAGQTANTLAALAAGLDKTVARFQL